MLTKKQIQYLHSLKDVAARKESHRFIVEGPKLVLELIETGLNVHCIYGISDWINIHQVLLQQKNIPYQVITPAELDKISSLTTPNQVLALAGIPVIALDWSLISKDLTLMLDGIQDPGNLGTIIRIADWFGIGQVICSQGSADVFNPKVVQASMGSVFRVNVFYEDLTEFLDDIPDDCPVFGAFLDGIPLSEYHLPDHGILVVGSESHGISDQVGEKITNRVKIPGFVPSHHQKGAESLNAGVATGILCFKFRFDSHPNGHHC